MGEGYAQSTTDSSDCDDTWRRIVAPDSSPARDFTLLAKSAILHDPRATAHVLSA
jgi:hypothetical protein